MSALDEAAQGAGQEPWIIAREAVIDDIPNSRPQLGYTVISDCRLFTYEEACEVHKELGLPLGWVRMKLSQLIPDASPISPAAIRNAALEEAQNTVRKLFSHEDLNADDGELAARHIGYLMDAECALQSTPHQEDKG